MGFCFWNLRTPIFDLLKGSALFSRRFQEVSRSFTGFYVSSITRFHSNCTHPSATFFENLRGSDQLVQFPTNDIKHIFYLVSKYITI